MNDYWQKRIAALELARLAWTDSAKWPLQYDLDRAIELAERGGGDRGDVPVTSFAEPDGSAIGYMDLVDFECEVGAASGGNRIYPSVDDLLLHSKCVQGCGIAEVRISGVRVLHPSNHFAPSEAEMMANLAASGMSALGQDPQGLEAKPASPTRSEAKGDAQ